MNFVLLIRIASFCSNFAAVFFLEYWKRKEITLAYQWDVLGFEEEEVSHKRINESLFHNGNEINCIINKSCIREFSNLSGKEE